MNTIVVAILVGGAVTLLAIFWIAYLFKVVLNDEDAQERIRRMLRRKEEKRRELEDQLHRRKSEEPAFDVEALKIAQSVSSPGRK